MTRFAVKFKTFSRSIWMCISEKIYQSFIGFLLDFCIYLMRIVNKTSFSYLSYQLKEFQAIYYVIGALNKINSFRFELLYPHSFLNCYFVCKMVQCANDAKFASLIAMLDKCEATRGLIHQIDAKFEFCKKLIN